jgi:glycosyltransferase involved in cell wall biosynthesis
MKIKRVFIISPALVDSSPVKGSAALANALCKWVPVVFVTLKCDNNNLSYLDNCIKLVSLGECKNWYKKIKKLQNILKNSGSSQSIATISSSFSADFANSFCTDLAITCTSVRGNLPINYVNTYGFAGKFLSYLHLNRLSKIKHVVSMTSAMADQVQRYIGRDSVIIGNFLDEKRLLKFKKTCQKQGPYKIIFSGSLCNRKQPMLIIESVSILRSKGYEVELDILGEGPLLDSLKNKVEELGLHEMVTFHGYLIEPYGFMSEFDVLVSTSLSEGVSRSTLEALYLGIPCVLRNVDGAKDLIQNGINGYLFNDDSEFADNIISAITLSRNYDKNKSLLPSMFRQNNSARQYLDLLESSI